MMTIDISRENVTHEEIISVLSLNIEISSM